MHGVSSTMTSACMSIGNQLIQVLLDSNVLHCVSGTSFSHDTLFTAWESLQFKGTTTPPWKLRAPILVRSFALW